jgi:hypothetical protein
MGHSEYGSAAEERRPWKLGRMVGPRSRPLFTPESEAVVGLSHSDAVSDSPPRSNRGGDLGLLCLLTVARHQLISLRTGWSLIRAKPAGVVICDVRSRINGDRGWTNRAPGNTRSTGAS